MARIQFVLKPNLDLKAVKERVLSSSKALSYDAVFTYSSDIQDIGAQLLISIGGDGTFLSTARFVATLKQAPAILGVNIGSLGFLTQFNYENFWDFVAKFFNGTAELETRSLLVLHGKTKRLLALNDIVISKSGVARILDYELYINDEFVSSIKADGLVVSTPTGSTAYSLASGGPIVESELNAIVLTPVSPHTLANRPLVINDNKIIKILVKNNQKDVIITADGQEFMFISELDEIKITKFKKKIKIIKTNDTGYYALLRRKLHLGVRG